MTTTARSVNIGFFLPLRFLMLRGGWYFFLIVNRVEPDRTPGRNNRISQGDQWMFESPSKNPLANVPHGLSFLNSISALFIQQEVNLGQSIFFKYSTYNLLYLLFSFSNYGSLKCSTFSSI
jgi:hypothetical protein